MSKTKNLSIPKSKPDLDCPAQYVSAIEKAVRKRLKTTTVTRQLQRGCFWYAFETLFLLRSKGINAIPQAGSASWLIVPDELDDGVSPTHYSYVYEGCTEMDVLLLMTEGILPEMHVWCAIPEANVVIDLTTKYVPVLSKEAGHLCRLVQPDYVWEDVKELTKRGIYYTPSEEATRIAWMLMHEQLTGGTNQ